MNKKTNKGKNMTDKVILEKSIKIFDKHFPKDKKAKRVAPT